MSEPILILDMGNVVFCLNFEPFESWFLKTFSPEEEKKKEKGTTKENRNEREKEKGNHQEKLGRFWNIYAEYEKNCYGDQEFLERVRTDLGASFGDEEFIAMWNTCWDCDMPGMEDWLDSLSPDLPVHVFSNTNALHMACFLKEKAILKRFDRLFLSHELGCRKPEAESYEKVARLLGADPGSILFFDDRPENIEGARRAGWEAEVFIGIPQSASRLERHMEKFR